MADELVSGVLKGAEVRVLVAVTTALSRRARELHGLRAASAELLAQGLTAASLLAALQLQKGTARVNVQVECDGPLRGLLADAGTDGTVRGYAKNPLVEILGNQNLYRYRPALGNSGFLSVLRDLRGDFYRSSVELEHLDLSLDLEKFFQASEQLPAAVLIDLEGGGDEPLGTVLGVLLQPLPDGDPGRMAKERARLRDQGDFARVLAGAHGKSADELLQALFGPGEVQVSSRSPLEFKCTCSKERVLDALLSTGRTELEDILAKEGRTELTCAFCSTVHAVSGEELRALLDRPLA